MNSFLHKNLTLFCLHVAVFLVNGQAHDVGWLGFWNKSDVIIIICNSFHGNFIFIWKKRKNSFALEKSLANCWSGCSYISEDPALKKALWSEKNPLCYLHLVQPSHFIPSCLAFLAASFSVCSGCIPKSTIKSPFVCVADDKCTEGILCFLGRQGTYFDWCSVVEKNELGRNYNGGPADWKGIYSLVLH